MQPRFYSPSQGIGRIGLSSLLAASLALSSCMSTPQAPASASDSDLFSEALPLECGPVCVLMGVGSLLGLAADTAGDLWAASGAGDYLKEFQAKLNKRALDNSKSLLRFYHESLPRGGETEVWTARVGTVAITYQRPVNGTADVPFGLYTSLSPLQKLKLAEEVNAKVGANVTEFLPDAVKPVPALIAFALAKACGSYDTCTIAPGEAIRNAAVSAQRVTDGATSGVAATIRFYERIQTNNENGEVKAIHIVRADTGDAELTDVEKQLRRVIEAAIAAGKSPSEVVEDIRKSIATIRNMTGAEQDALCELLRWISVYLEQWVRARDTLSPDLRPDPTIVPPNPGLANAYLEDFMSLLPRGPQAWLKDLLDQLFASFQGQRPANQPSWQDYKDALDKLESEERKLCPDTLT